jgi:hypothetical protein
MPNSFFGDPLDPTDWKNYIFGPATFGPGIIESGIRRITNSGKPKLPVNLKPGTGMQKIQDELARAKARRQGSTGRSNQPSLADIMARLEALQDPSRFQPDINALSAQARSAADAQFNPVIAQLRAQAASAQQRGERGKQEIGNMYGALSSNIASRVPVIEEQYAGTKQETEGQYQQLRDSIANQYNTSMQEQEEMLKRLNIEAAAAGTMPQQQRDRDYFTNVAAKEGQTAQTALGMEERGATEFTSRGSDIARFEGTNRQADLMAQLADYINQVNSEIGSTESAREAAYNTNLSELQAGFSENAQRRAQQEFQNYIASIKLARELQGDMGGASSVKTLADVPSRAMGLGLIPQDAQAVQDVFSQAVGGDEFILGGLNTQSGTPATKEALAARVVELGRQQGMNRQQLNALQLAALEYFGRQ